ncbi:MAG TPA: CsbD family protein [Polyangia bacterium]|jgi:uncharacterized protein YjbJ (UPF0337 family)|nr:CsbD family protein [Polyangia bacterium]
MGEFSKKAKGRIEQAVGGLTGNKRLQKEGEADERAGKVEGAVADVKHAVKDAKHALEEVSK